MSEILPQSDNDANIRLAQVAARLAVKEGLKVSAGEDIKTLLKRIAVKKGVKLPHRVRTQTVIAELLAVYGVV